MISRLSRLGIVVALGAVAGLPLAAQAPITSIGLGYRVEPVDGPVRAVLAPHIDPRGGFACHGAAIAALAACPAEVFVVLGTAHRPLYRPFALTTLDSATNGDFAGRIQSGRLGAWIFRYEDKGERIKR